ncbi:hypothetical protein B0H15DRAFT_958067 [Mycena belliarum]|uniref:Uncharacterized protein n=1 Tax=Mycena belliarum TaxID=1033014 RepID=A0AAD6TN66_9AGAR|nr:hypothetical protein B0H15DRAFT_958067 [Mycena belliae]
MALEPSRRLRMRRRTLPSLLALTPKPPQPLIWLLSRARALGLPFRSSLVALAPVLAPSADAGAPAPAPCSSLRPAHLIDAALSKGASATPSFYLNAGLLYSPRAPFGDALAVRPHHARVRYDRRSAQVRPPLARRPRHRRLGAQGPAARSLRLRLRGPRRSIMSPASPQTTLVHTSVRAARPTSAAATSTPAACTIAAPRAARTDSPEVRARLPYRCVVTVRVRLPALTPDVRAAAFERLTHSPLHATVHLCPVARRHRRPRTSTPARRAPSQAAHACSPANPLRVASARLATSPAATSHRRAPLSRAASCRRAPLLCRRSLSLPSPLDGHRPLSEARSRVVSSGACDVSIRVPDARVKMYRAPAAWTSTRARKRIGGEYDARRFVREP